MIQIQPVSFPLNLGIANKITITLLVSPNTNGARVSYILLDDTVTPPKRLATNFLEITEENYTMHGNDKQWITNYVVEQLGLTLI